MLTHPQRGWHRKAIAILASFASAAALTLFPAAAASAAPVTGAGFTTVNESVDGTGHCQNGNPNVNCNIYDGKQYVWLNGGPSTAYVGDGTYFFAVLVPGGQADPNDGAANNLSDDFDAYTNRTFSVSGGTVSYTGSHDFDSNKIRLAPYADTTNPGGVYILAICSLSAGSYPVDASLCKYDAFKVSSEPSVEAQPLTITKDAAGTYQDTWQWGISKSVDKTKVTQVGGSATFNYTVNATHDSGTISDVSVTGTIDVTNPNVDASNNTLPVTITSVTDELSDGTVCTVTVGSTTLSSFHNLFPYTCQLTSLPNGNINNVATVTWAEQFLDDGSHLSGGSSDFTFKGVGFSGTNIDNCVSVSDSFKGTLGTVCSTDASPTAFNYSRTIAIPTYDCKSYDNTATFTTNTTGSTGSASQSVTVCGPIHTGALTIGFWQNKNGQAIVTGGASTAGVCNSATWLRQFAPFQDLSATATCSQVGTYVTNVIKAANASGSSMNAMLKAQMLATALDTYFSSPALGGNKIGAPAPIGGVAIDLTKICKVTDGTGGTGTCGGAFENVSTAFGGASSLTISQILTYVAGQSNVGGSAWYGNVKATQQLAKDTFDAINNQFVFAP